MLRVHHLNCATMCPWGGALVSGEGSLVSAATLVCHCLLIESASGLILVDSGLSRADAADAQRRLGREFVSVVRPQLKLAETAIAQVQALGFDPRDVRDVVLTHLDVDHAGGISDFPWARVHVLRAEYEAAMTPGRRAAARYRQRQFAHFPRWRLHEPVGDTWLGEPCVAGLPDLPDDLRLVPLSGHSKGHTAVAIRQGDGWLVHAGDAYFYRGEMHPARRYCPPALRAFQWVLADDRQQQRSAQRRLATAVNREQGRVRVFCAHDPVEFERLAGSAAGAVSVDRSLRGVA